MYLVLRHRLAAWSLMASVAVAWGLEPLPLPPTQAMIPARLPMLVPALVPDGVLDEWPDAACIPVRTEPCIAFRAQGHEWRGAADAGMEFYAAWSPAGLCLAAEVADDDVVNIQPDALLYQQDCIELYIDARAGDRFLTAPYTPGAAQLLVRPPLPDRPAAVVSLSPDFVLASPSIGGRRTATGYTVEMVLPWTCMPQLKPQGGTRLGLQCSLDDWDRRDGGISQNLMMTIHGAPFLAYDPSRFVCFELADRDPASDVADVSLEVVVDMPRIVSGSASLPLLLTAGGRLARDVSSAEVSLRDSSGPPVWQERLPAVPLPAPWADSWQAESLAPTGGMQPGTHMLTVTVVDTHGQPCGTTQRPVYVLGDVLTPLYDELRRADIAALARREPFRAAAYCAVGVAVERLKRAHQMGDLATLMHAQHEAVARLRLLKQEQVPASAAEEWLAWLLLASRPESQVTVDFREADHLAWVSFAWGGAPLATVEIRRYPNEQAALNDFEAISGKPGLPELPDSAIVAGCPARFYRQRDYELPQDPDTYRPDSQLMVLPPGGQQAWIVPLDRLDEVHPAAVTILPSCPAAVSERIRSWAATRSLKPVGLAEAQQAGVALLAGDPRLEAASMLPATAAWKRLERRPYGELSVVRGPHLFWVGHPCQEVARQAVQLVLAGQPVTPEQTDAMRRALVAWAGSPAGSTRSVSTQLFGDVHSHTFYSDGAESPVALLLEAISSQLDFLIVTDHNTLDGALLLRQLMAKHGCTFPVTVGEEISAEYAHMNAYPVDRLIDWNLPADEAVRAAHAQRAVIQWNHPGSPGSPWDFQQQPRGLAGTAFDAWEGYTPYLALWRQKGIVPVLVGGTDSHDALYAGGPRTVVCASAAHDHALTAAIRAGQVGLLTLDGGEYLYGQPELEASVWTALADKQRLREEKASRLRAALQQIDLAGLLSASPAAPLSPQAATSP